jgi:V/A-type H+-transporting ATPase subunit K
MEGELLRQIGIGGSFGLSALGAALAMGLGGPAVIGSYKKCYVQNKPASFLLVIFAGTSLTNVIYGFVVMGALFASTLEAIFILGLGAGLTIGAIAVTQSMCSASAADAFAETGKGYANYMMVIGLAETVSLFAMIFTMMFV